MGIATAPVMDSNNGRRDEAILHKDDPFMSHNSNILQSDLKNSDVPNLNVLSSIVTLAINASNVNISDPNPVITVLNNATSSQGVFESKLIIPLYVIIFLLAVVGNSLVIVTLVQNKRMRTVTNVYLLNLVSCFYLYLDKIEPTMRREIHHKRKQTTKIFSESRFVRV